MINLLEKIKSNITLLVTTFKSIPKFAWVIIMLAFIGGYLIQGGDSQLPDSYTNEVVNLHEDEVTWWTCSMHPHIKLPKEGQCPICFMDLIPMETGTNDDGPRELRLSPTAVELAEIQTSKIERGVAKSNIILSGTIEYDETRVKTITSWIPGRLERLYVDYTGIKVSKGDHLVDIYSPELYATQEELIQASKRIGAEKTQFTYSTAELTLEAAKEKLSLFGLTQNQIEEIEKRGVPKNQLTIFSPLSGIVIHKNAVEGRYVQTGTPIYTIADLSRVWIVLDAYEKDLPWIRFGQDVTITTEGLPGESFTGRIAFIDPVLDPKTRTVKVRININNKDNKLKPGMFVKAEVTAVLDSEGKSVNNYLAGKWISPMHPEVVKEGPGQCDICGMDLVKAETLGIVQAPSSSSQPLLIPATAVLKTGNRAVVYLKIMDRDEPTFMSREVVLGPRAGDSYIVLSGLLEGDVVVTNGNFKIDSAMQIAAKPSMMNPKGGVAMTGHEGHGSNSKSQPKVHTTTTQVTNENIYENLKSGEVFLKAVNPLYDEYFIVQAALANDDMNQAKKAMYNINQLVQTLSDDPLGLSGKSLNYWENAQATILNVTEHALHWSNIEELRDAFNTLGTVIIELEKNLGHGGKETFFEIFCPMAFDNTGAYWLQTDKKVNNPYFGLKMSRCGEVKSELRPAMEMNSKERGEGYE